MEISGVKVKVLCLCDNSSGEFINEILDDLLHLFKEQKNIYNEYYKKAFVSSNVTENITIKNASLEFMSELGFLMEQNSLSFDCIRRIRKLQNKKEVIIEIKDLISYLDEEYDYFNNERLYWENAKESLIKKRAKLFDKR